ncbi:VWA domain-containing protein [Chitinophagales bacterium]|nr:VWA domain-containing protein [Chitinophagales bacterium]
MLKLAHSVHLWALILSIFLLFFFVIFLIRRKRFLALAGKQRLIQKLVNTSNVGRKYLKFALMILAFISLVIAWANPLLGTKFENVTREGIDVIFALDVSKSMNAQDIVPSRMLKAKQIVSKVIEEMSNDRIGLIVFAGNAYLQMPITVDYSGAKMYLKSVDTDMVPRQGTAISEAIQLAIDSYDDNSEGYQSLVILSDGENHDGDAENLAKEAQELGIVIHTIGVGTSQAAKIPLDDRGNFKMDNSGNVVTTQLNEEMLKNLADIGGGKYLNAASTEIYDDILVVLNGQEGRMIDEKVYTSFKNHFPIFLLIGFIGLCLEFILSERKSTYLSW